MSEFKKSLSGFYNEVKNEACTSDECLYIEFGFKEDKAICRRGYRTARGLLKHLENTNKESNSIEENIIENEKKIVFIGPEAELDMLKELFEGAQFFALFAGLKSFE